MSLTVTVKMNFYPRPPRGGRHSQMASHARLMSISIHALREEGDVEINEEVAEEWHFYPRPPRGGRPV